MSKSIFFSIVLQTFFILISSECQLQIPLDPPAPTSQGISNEFIYILIPIYPVGVYQNSICLYNEMAELLDCYNMSNFKDEMSIPWDSPSFLAMKYISDDLYLINYVQDDVYFSVSDNSAHWIIIDEYFNIKYYSIKYLIIFN